MQAKTAAFGLNVQGLASTFDALNNALNQASEQSHQLFMAANTPVQNEDDLLQRAELLDLLMEMAKSEEDICMLYAQSISDRIEDFETTLELPSIPAAEMLKEMMSIRGIKQKDLVHIATQSTISAILNGKRQITAQQAKAFAEYFQLPVERFID